MLLFIELSVYQRFLKNILNLDNKNNWAPIKAEH